jgi:hypothetical protein
MVTVGLGPITIYGNLTTMLYLVTFVVHTNTIWYDILHKRIGPIILLLHYIRRDGDESYTQDRERED